MFFPSFELNYQIVWLSDTTVHFHDVTRIHAIVMEPNRR